MKFWIGVFLMFSPIIVLTVFLLYGAFVGGHLLQILITFLVLALVIAIMYFGLFLVDDATD